MEVSYRTRLVKWDRITLQGGRRNGRLGAPLSTGRAGFLDGLLVGLGIGDCQLRRLRQKQFHLSCFVASGLRRRHLRQAAEVAADEQAGVFVPVESSAFRRLAAD